MIMVEGVALRVEGLKFRVEGLRLSDADPRRDAKFCVCVPHAPIIWIRE